MTALICLFLLGLTAVAVKHILRWRETARSCASRACQALSVQLLDASVSWRSFHINRKRWAMEVQYQFDFSEDGSDRHDGLITMIGGHPVQVVVTSNRLGRLVLDPNDWRTH